MMIELDNKDRETLIELLKSKAITYEIYDNKLTFDDIESDIGKYIPELWNFNREFNSCVESTLKIIKYDENDKLLDILLNFNFTDFYEFEEVANKMKKINKLMKDLEKPKGKRNFEKCYIGVNNLIFYILWWGDCVEDTDEENLQVVLERVSSDWGDV